MTLKSLGLTSGKAMLRMIHRDLVQLKTQAHVSTTLIPKSLKDPENDRIKHNKQRISSASYEGKALDPITLLKEERNKARSQGFKHIEDNRTKDEEKRSDNNRDRDNAMSTCDRRELSNNNDTKDKLGTNLHSNAEEEINIEFVRSYFHNTTNNNLDS